MYTHNLDPTLLEIGFFSLKWYSLAYILGILIGWWLSKRIILYRKFDINHNLTLDVFDNFISYVIISIILGGRLGYIVFYNLDYYFFNPLDIFKIWEGGMSFHGALIGIIISTIYFAKKNDLKFFILTDLIAYVAPIGLFFGRIANFINAELYGKPTSFIFGVIFPNIDNLYRHPSQLYEAFLEGILLFLIMNFLILNKKYYIGKCSYLFLIFYGIFRMIAEIFREPDKQIGYIFNIISMGSLLSLLMILTGIFLLRTIRKNENK